MEGVGKLTVRGSVTFWTALSTFYPNHNTHPLGGQQYKHWKPGPPPSALEGWELALCAGCSRGGQEEAGSAVGGPGP